MLFANNNSSYNSSNTQYRLEHLCVWDQKYSSTSAMGYNLLRSSKLKKAAFSHFSSSGKLFITDTRALVVFQLPANRRAHITKVSNNIPSTSINHIKAISTNENVPLWNAMAMHPKRDLVALASTYKDTNASYIVDLYEWSANGFSKRKVLTIKGGTTITALAFNPKGDVLAVGQADGAISLFAWANRTKPYHLKKDLFSISALAFSPDNRLLVAAGRSGGTSYAIKQWDLTTATPKRRGWLGQQTVGKSNITAISFRRDGKYLASVDARGVVALWDVAQRKNLQVQSFGTNNTSKPAPPDVFFMPNCLQFIVGLGGHNTPNHTRRLECK